MTITQQRPLPAGVVGLAQVERGPRYLGPDTSPSGTLIVGQSIRVKGDIESCRNLVVEGRVEAALEGETLQVLKGGLFKGTAVVDRAEVAGTFEGTLTVRGQLTIKTTGRASGEIGYQRIIIEGGGEIAGKVVVGEGPQSEPKSPTKAKATVA